MRYLILIVGAALIASAAAAQERHEPSVTNRDWSVYQATQNGAKVCWAATAPKFSTAKRGGKRVEVRRGDITLNVATRPGAGVAAEISVMMGYPLKDGSEVELNVGSSSFSLFSDGETAWSRPADDAGIAAAFRRGSEAKVVGVSARGTTTTDTFSLLGYTDSVNGARDACK